jgi:nicotinate dehydrogenase subunit A
MKNFTVAVNGHHRQVKADADTPLLYVLRNDLDLKGPRFGCGLGQCGACTVIIGG